LHKYSIMKRKILFFFLFIGLFSACQNEDTKEAKSIQFNLPEGFVLEDLYSPSENEQGSWVALAKGVDNQYFACDQRGSIYQFTMPDKQKVLDKSMVKELDLPIGHAHGLLWAFNSLYVAVNKNWNNNDKVPGSGIYRITDQSGDGNLDHVDTLLVLDGAGEHGPHNFALSPDGKHLYFLAGNHVAIPDVVKQNSRLPTNWDEDNLFRPYLDARGHANDVKAPGGWIAKMDETGTNWELVSAGYRNPFDLAFNAEGELFTYDADMEWDIGMPWYRPTRINHVTSGSEFGWRTGSGKWPEYYPDNLPAVVNLEQGSPTGILMANQVNVPSKYKNGLFIMDWSFGTIYFIDLQEDGSTYKATKEEFLSGVPLPLTDLIAGADGNIYFATGGRGLASHLYRLTYKSNEAGTAKLTKNEEAASLRSIRKKLETFHTKNPEAIAAAWPYLNHTDRFIRYAARIALEHQATNTWELNFFREKNPLSIIHAGIALARQAPAGMQEKIFNKLNTIDWDALATADKADLIRAYNLLGIRMGKPRPSVAQSVINKLSPHFPNANNLLNREMSQLFLFLEAKDAVKQVVEALVKSTKEKTLTSENMLAVEITDRSEQYGPLIREVLENMPPSEAIYYGVLLSHIKDGWTPDLREKYFQWFYDVMSAKGGLSFKPFMENVRVKAVSNIPEAQRKHYNELSGVYSPIEALDDLPEPIGPGKEYHANDIQRLLSKKLRNYQGDIAAGKRAYQAAMCGTCHRMRGEGGTIGPDLTQINTKFGRYNLVFSIVSPNDEISDQYAFTLFHLKGDKKQAGRLLSEDEESVTIMPNPYSSNYTVKFAKSDILKKEFSPVSPMPPGLLNRLNEDEIADLFAYLLAGGDESDDIYKK
jgi:putative heme-binding domain-containing protein